MSESKQDRGPAVGMLVAAHVVLALAAVAWFVWFVMTKDAPARIKEYQGVAHAGLWALSVASVAGSLRVKPPKHGYVGSLLARAAALVLPFVNIIVLLTSMPVGGAKASEDGGGGGEERVTILVGERVPAALPEARAARYRSLARQHRFFGGVLSVVILLFAGATLLREFLPEATPGVLMGAYLLAWLASLVTMCRTWITYGRLDAVMFGWPVLMGFLLLFPVLNIAILRGTAPELVELPRSELGARERGVQGKSPGG